MKEDSRKEKEVSYQRKTWPDLLALKLEEVNDKSRNAVASRNRKMQGNRFTLETPERNAPILIV